MRRVEIKGDPEGAVRYCTINCEKRRYRANLVIFAFMLGF
jgi:hypothetical protein